MKMLYSELESFFEDVLEKHCTCLNQSLFMYRLVLYLDEFLSLGCCNFCVSLLDVFCMRAVEKKKSGI